MKVKHWQVKFINEGQRKLATDEYPGRGFAICCWFWTKEEAESTCKNWHPSYPGDPWRFYTVEQVEDEIDVDGIVKVMQKVKETGHTDGFGYVLHNPDDVLGSLYASLAKDVGVGIEYDTHNGDHRMRFVPLSRRRT